MKRRILFIVAVLHLAIFGIACSDRESQNKAKEASTTEQGTDSGEIDTTAALIQPGVGVGQVTFNMTIDDVNAVLGDPDSPAEGTYYLYADLGIEVIFEEDEVHSIHCIHHIDGSPNVRACKYRTAEGIGIGSTESEVESAYRKAFKLCNGNLMYRGLKFGIEDGRVQTISVSRSQSPGFPRWPYKSFQCKEG